MQVQSLGGEDSWRRTWQPIPVFLPGDSLWTEEPWQAMVHRVTNSWTWLKQLTTLAQYRHKYHYSPTHYNVPRISERAIFMPSATHSHPMRSGSPWPLKRKEEGLWSEAALPGSHSLQEITGGFEPRPSKSWTSCVCEENHRWKRLTRSHPSSPDLPLEKPVCRSGSNS